MSDWSSGYNTDLGYTFGYYREISPEWLNYVAWTKSITPPTGAWRYMELGCGQGLGLALLAAVNPDYEFLGIDFNPVHITHARNLAQAAGLKNVRFEEADFLSLADSWPTEWGEFDYITAHGIYTWLDFDVCKAMVRAIDNAAAPGALVYLSYNTLPAWVSSYPIQHLMRLWQTSENIESVKAIGVGIDRLQQLTEAQSGMTKLLPGMKSMLDKVAGRDRAYLVQEYLHDHWNPRWFDQVVEELKPAKLSYVGTANLSDLFITSFMPTQFKDILNTHSDPIVREVMIDVLVNQSFRRDVFTRGGAPQWPIQRQEAFLEQRFALLSRPADTNEIKFKTSMGELKGRSDIYTLFYDELTKGPKTAAELMQVSAPKALTFSDIQQALSFMLSAGHVVFHNPPDDPGPALALNRAIAAATASGAPYRFIIASQSGHVLTVSDVDLMFLHQVLKQPEMQPPQLGEGLVNRLLTLGKGLSRKGEPLTSRSALQPYAEELARAFLTQTLPRWKQLGVCE